MNVTVCRYLALVCRVRYPHAPAIALALTNLKRFPLTELPSKALVAIVTPQTRGHTSTLGSIIRSSLAFEIFMSLAVNSVEKLALFGNRQNSYTDRPQ